MNEAINPPDLAPPAAAYSHAVRTISATTWVHTSGVVPTAPDGSVTESIEDQAAQVWANIASILRASGMQVTDVVSVTTYVVAGHGLGPVMAARDAAMAGHRPASTLVTVPALARPEWKMEIAVIAAR